MAEIERRGADAVILSGGPMSVYDPDAPKADAAMWSGRLPVLGICYGAQLMALELGGDVARRPRASTARRPSDHPRRRPVRRARPRAAGLDEPRRLDHAPARGLPATAQTDSTPFAGLADPSAACTGSSSTPRWSTRRAAATSCATSSSASPATEPTWTPANFIDSTVAEIRARVDKPRPRDRVGRQGHLRAVGRRRLGGRGGARPSRRRRSADLHLRRPRADAQARVGAAAGRPSRPTSACAW